MGFLNLMAVKSGSLMDDLIMLDCLMEIAKARKWEI